MQPVRVSAGLSGCSGERGMLAGRGERHMDGGNEILARRSVQGQSRSVGTLEYRPRLPAHLREETACSTHSYQRLPYSGWR